MSDVRSSEGGIAMIIVVLLGVIASGLIIAILMSSQTSMTGMQSRSAREVGLPPADDAIASYRFALQSQLVDETTDFRFDASSGGLAHNLPSGGASWVKNSSLPAAFRKPELQLDQIVGSGAKSFEKYEYTMKEPQTDSAGKVTGYGWWQIYHVTEPDYSSTTTSNVVVYIRAWTSGPGNRIATAPRIIRVELRAGRFTDYQILADGPIAFGDGAIIDGPIHSNGYKDGFMLSAAKNADDPKFRIWAYDGVDPKPRCRAGASFETTSGEVQMLHFDTSCDDAKVKEKTGRTINMLRVEDSLTMINDRCGTATVKCYKDHTHGGARVMLYDNGGVKVVESGATHHLTALGKSLTILNEGDITIAGMLKGKGGTQGSRVTIAAWQPISGSHSMTAQYPSIYIRNDTGTYVKDHPEDVLGLIAQGDIIPDLDTCPTTLNAAMIAQGGSLRIPPQYRTWSAPTGDAPWCEGKLTVKGSIAGHFAPLTVLRWGADVAVGYDKRLYQYNANLYLNPPPFFPLTGPWAVVDWRDANRTCLKKDHLGDPTCR